MTSPQCPGPTSCALGSHSFDSVNANHLCKDRSFISSTIYFPKTSSGSEQEKQQLPSVVLVAGYGDTEEVVSAWGPFYASHGIVAMTIGTPKPWEDMPKDRCEYLLEAAEALQSEHTCAGSVLEGRLDGSRRALHGYSMGGGGAEFAALEDPTLKCVIASTPYGGPEVPSAVVPSLVICGQVDPTANPKTHSWKPYERTAAPKMIFEVSGQGHYAANGPSGGNEKDSNGDGEECFMMLNCVAGYCGFTPCPNKYGYSNGPSGHAKDEAPQGAVGGVALAWLQLFLVGDEEARSTLLTGRPKIASGFESHGLEKPMTMDRNE